MNAHFRTCLPLVNRLRRLAPKMSCAALLLLSLGVAQSQTSQTWFSLQEGDLRSGSDSATVNTNGTLVTTNYVTGVTYIRGFANKNSVFNGGTEYDMGTSANGTSDDIDYMRLLASFDLTPVANYVAGQAYSVDAVNFILWHRTAGQGSSSTMDLHSTTAFDETTATWNSPGGGAPAGGTVGTLLQSMQIPQGAAYIYPSNEVFNSTALRTAVQNALGNATNKTASFLGKRGTETDAAFFGRYVTDENTDLTYGGVNGRPELQVRVTIYSNAPLVSVTAVDDSASEPGTNTGMFMITRSLVTTNELTVYFTMSGAATLNGDYQLNPAYSGSVFFPANVTTTNILLEPLDDASIEDDESATLTLIPDTSTPGAYGISVSSATVTIADDNDAGAYVQYLFGGNFHPKVLGAGVDATDWAAGPGLSWGFSSISLSAPLSAFASGNNTSSNETQALAENDYASFTLSSQIANSLDLTNLELTAYYDVIHSLDAGAANATVFVRSSVDGYASNLGSVAVVGDNIGGTWTPLSIPLGSTFSNLISPVTFRIYVYDDMTNAGVSGGVRIDNVFVRGNAGALPPGVQRVFINATSPNASEPSSPGQFTVSRYGSTASSLAVNYSITGTASNGVDYAQLNGQVTIGAGQSNAVITVSPIDDLLLEGSETVILTLLSDPNYDLVAPTAATVTIADDAEPTQASVVASDDNAYERVSALGGAFTITRLSDTSSSTTVNFSLGGTAVMGVDYATTATNSIVIPAGQTSQTIIITPLPDTAVEGTETIELTLLSGAGYALIVNTNATVSLYDDDLPAESVLWSDNFDSGTSGGNYSLTSGATGGPDDYVADFAFNYAGAGIPLAPGSTNGIGLKMTANKDATAAAAGVNVYPTGQSFSNDFALRMNLYLNYHPTGTNGENVLFGINQSGTLTNWRSASPALVSGEGVWGALSVNDQDLPSVAIWASTNAGGAPVLVTSRNQPGLVSFFNSPPFGLAGAMGNPFDSTNKTWLDVELSQVAGLITLKLNGAVALTYTNTTSYTNGNIFLGYNDQFSSIGSTEGYAVFDNIRVVQAAAASATQPVITHIGVSGGVVTVNFSGGVSDTTASFKLQSAANATGAFADDNAANITGSGGAFQASTAVNGARQFYRIRRN